MFIDTLNPFSKVFSSISAYIFLYSHSFTDGVVACGRISIYYNCPPVEYKRIHQKHTVNAVKILILQQLIFRQKWNIMYIVKIYQ